MTVTVDPTPKDRGHWMSCDTCGQMGWVRGSYEAAQERARRHVHGDFFRRPR